MLRDLLISRVAAISMLEHMSFPSNLCHLMTGFELGRARPVAAIVDDGLPGGPTGTKKDFVRAMVRTKLITIT